MNKPNGQRCDTRPPSTIHQCIAAPCSVHCSRVQCTAVCQKPGAGVRGVHPVSAMAPSGWGQVLARARACPPVLEVDVPISPSGGDPFPESHSPHRQWLPSNNIARILIAFCFFSGLFTRKHTHFMAEMLFFHACELFETDKWCTPASTPKIWTPMTAVFRLSTTQCDIWISVFDHLVCS